MTRFRKILLAFVTATVVIAGLLALGGYYLTNDFRQREKLLQPLLATNAHLSVIIAKTGEFTIVRRDTPFWKEMLSRYSSGSKWDQHIAQKIGKCWAYGHTSTMDMQTWIFLDQNDRLIDFELGTQ